MATTKQKKVAKILLENKGMAVSRAMLEAGYPPTTAKNPQQLTQSQGWQQLMEEYLPDAEIAEKHKQLLNQTRVEYFVFPKTMSDGEILEKVSSAGLDLIVIQNGEKGRYAFYATADANARSKAIDMAYKLKGSYAPEKSIVANINLNADKEQRSRELVRGILGNRKDTR